MPQLGMLGLMVIGKSRGGLACIIAPALAKIRCSTWRGPWRNL